MCARERIGARFKDSNMFLASVHGMYRMDRGDRMYVKRHFRRWFDVARILEDIQRRRSGFMKILDVGCGSGFFMVICGGQVFGLDDDENVEVCRRRGLQAYPIDLEKDCFPFKDASFDVTVCLEVIEHLTNPRNVLSEMSRVLKPNGYLLISTPNNRMPTWWIRDFLLRLRFVGQIYMNRDLGSDLKRYDRDELRNVLQSHDFETLGLRYSRILLPADDLLVVAKKA